MNLAELTAAEAGNDGLKFEAMEKAAKIYGGSKDERGYWFHDGSRITVLCDAWDIGFADCDCFASHGHSERCTDRELTADEARVYDRGDDAATDARLDPIYRAAEMAAEMAEKAATVSHPDGFELKTFEYRPC